MRKKSGILLILILLILVSCGFGFSYLSKSTGKNGPFTVASGSSSKDVFKALEDEGYVRNGDVAYYYSRFFHQGSFKAGDYELPGMEMNELIDYLSDSKNIIEDTVNITFIEGDWLKDIAKKIADNTNLSAEECMSYWDNPDVIKGLMAQYPFLTDEILASDIRHPLEGYMFPNTYTFYRETTLEEVTKKILNQTNLVYEKYSEQFAANALSIHEIFTLASIVQYEASSSEDMGLVAGVFLNRLAISMPLQSSVTVCYAIDLEDDSNWQQCEYNSDFDSPYNTYMVNGLPPGPIVNPGEEAVKAVLNPTESNYYYFIADVCGDGKVYYAETYEQHQQNVKEYLWCY